MSKILVTGATGQQGGSVVKSLLEAGHTVRAMTRTPHGDRAKALFAAGVEIVQGDFGDSASLEEAMTGVDGVFLMGTPFEAGIDAEIEQGIRFVEAAHKVAVGHLVYTSVGDADRNTGIPHFDSKYLVEKRIIELGIPYTILAPVFFYDNMMAPFVLPGMDRPLSLPTLGALRTTMAMLRQRRH